MLNQSSDCLRDFKQPSQMLDHWLDKLSVDLKALRFVSAIAQISLLTLLSQTMSQAVRVAASQENVIDLTENVSNNSTLV
jgi:hypothetical protein